jgi:hypothetical protein
MAYSVANNFLLASSAAGVFASSIIVIALFSITMGIAFAIPQFFYTTVALRNIAISLIPLAGFSIAPIIVIALKISK